MLSRIAWRNIWRSKVRSLVVIAAVVLGIWAGTFIMSFSFGMSEQLVRSSIEEQISHIQIRNPDYKEDRNITFTIPGADSLAKKIAAMQDVKAVCTRTIINGMASSATNGTGIIINGIHRADEDSVTHVSKNLIKGNFFSSGKKNLMLISERLAEKLNVGEGNKVILTFQDVNGNITAGAFRISGIFKTKSSVYDDANVFVLADDLNNLAGLRDSAHEIAVLLSSDKNMESIQDSIKKMAPGMSVENWRELAPELRLVIDSFAQYMYLFIAVILLALGFGIVNTMLMAVLERVHELGMLMSIGMNRTKVFLMIMIETIYLSLTGGPIGLLLAYFTITLVGRSGINLSMFSKGFESYGMSPIVYPNLQTNYYFEILIMIIAAALLSAIYPSIRAIRIKPAEAIKI